MTPSASNSGGRRLRTDHRCRALGDPKDGSALVVEHLTKRFAERVAFDDVSSRSGAARCSASSVSTGRGRPQPCIPLFAYWGICAAIAVSARSMDVPVLAQRLSVLGSVPLLAIPGAAIACGLKGISSSNL